MRTWALVAAVIVTLLAAAHASSQEPAPVCISPEEARNLEMRINILNARLLGNEIKMNGLFIQYIEAHHESEQ